MESTSKKIVLKIDNTQFSTWELFLKNEFKDLDSSNIEIDCRDLNFSCIDIMSIIKISNKYNCTITGFCSTSPKTIISAQSLGYPSQFIFRNYSKKTLNKSDCISDQPKTLFHQGTVRSGEYIDSPGDLLILGDVNPGAIVSAEGNVIIWGKLLGIAHAGNKGNSKAKISALHLRPVQLRIATKVARGPQEKPQIGLAEQARIFSEKIVIYPLDII